MHNRPPPNDEPRLELDYDAVKQRPAEPAHPPRPRFDPPPAAVPSPPASNAGSFLKVLVGIVLLIVVAGIVFAAMRARSKLEESDCYKLLELSSLILEEDRVDDPWTSKEAARMSAQCDAAQYLELEDPVLIEQLDLFLAQCDEVDDVNARFRRLERDPTTCMDECFEALNRTADDLEARLKAWQVAHDRHCWSDRSKPRPSL